MKNTDIIKMARSFITCWHTNDPYEIAERMGICVIHRDTNVDGFTAQTVKIDGYPTIISINNAYTDFSKKLLCAHELGHALMHENCINHFATTSSNIATSVEAEANLFAIALLSDAVFDYELKVPLSQMNNYLLKSIMDYNLKKI